MQTLHLGDQPAPTPRQGNSVRWPTNANSRLTNPPDMQACCGCPSFETGLVCSKPAARQPTNNKQTTSASSLLCQPRFLWCFRVHGQCMHARLDLLVQQPVHQLVPLHQPLALKLLRHNLNPVFCWVCLGCVQDADTYACRQVRAAEALAEMELEQLLAVFPLLLPHHSMCACRCTWLSGSAPT